MIAKGFKQVIGVSASYYKIGTRFRRHRVAPRLQFLQTKLLLRTIMSCSTQQSQSDLKQLRGEADDRNVESQKSGRQQGTSFVDAHNLKQTNLYFTKDSTPLCAIVVHPGFTSESVGHYRQPKLSSLFSISTHARVYAMHIPVDSEGHTFFEYDQMTSGYYTFISSIQLDISPAMYDWAIPKWPLEVKIQGGHVGRTSMSTVTTMFSAADAGHQKLMTQITQVVLVDKVMRRPVPIRDQWRDKYQGHCVRGEPLIIKRQEMPQSGALSVYEAKVAWSDTDFYNHTNFATYARFAMDAVHDALRQNRLGEHLSEADLSAGVRQVRVAYVGESVEGDLLQVKVWPGREGERCVVCSMEKEGQVINQVTLSFFTP